jgi:hypothetical protein
MQFGLNFTAADASKLPVGALMESGGSAIASETRAMRGEDIDDAYSKGGWGFDEDAIVLIVDSVLSSGEAGPSLNWVTHVWRGVGVESCTLFSARRESFALTANRGVQSLELTAAECDAYMMLVNRHMRDGVDELWSVGVEYARRYRTGVAVFLLRSQQLPH